MLTQQFLKADQDQSINDKIGCDNECGLLYAPFRVGSERDRRKQGEIDNNGAEISKAQRGV